MFRAEQGSGRVCGRDRERCYPHQIVVLIVRPLFAGFGETPARTPRSGLPSEPALERGDLEVPGITRVLKDFVVKDSRNLREGGAGDLLAPKSSITTAAGKWPPASKQRLGLRSMQPILEIPKERFAVDPR